MKNNKRNSIIYLILCMIVCTLFTVNGVFASLNQSLITNGSLNVKSYGHVNATITVEVEEVNFRKEINILETEAKTEHTVAGFAEAFESAFSGNVETDENDGRIAVKDTATVKITIVNTSVDYDLANYEIVFAEQNKVNMKSTVITGDVVGTNIVKNGGSVEVSFVIKVDDTRLSASGDYSWAIILVAANN